jgi:hypothetical protein
LPKPTVWLPPRFLSLACRHPCLLATLARPCTSSLVRLSTSLAVHGKAFTNCEVTLSRFGFGSPTRLPEASGEGWITARFIFALLSHIHVLRSIRPFMVQKPSIRKCRGFFCGEAPRCLNRVGVLRFARYAAQSCFACGPARPSMAGCSRRLSRRSPLLRAKLQVGHPRQPSRSRPSMGLAT